MSASQTRPLRRERRAAQLAARRAAQQRPAARTRQVGIGQITIVSLVAGIALISAIFLLNGQPKGTTQTDLVRAAAPAGIATAGLVLGRADAPVVVDLYEDFQCPACLSWGQNVFPTLAQHELASGTIRIQFHGFSFLGQESIDAARAAWAANEQGRFWDMWATLYANQGLHENAGAFAREQLIAMADLIGLDHARFLTDFDSPGAAHAVADSTAAATAAGVNSTPTLMLNGQRFTGAGYIDLSTAIKAAGG
jgi:protein-disulfide isomerase